MTVCRFFNQGYCRYGSKCRFEHTNAYKYVNYSNQHQQTTANRTVDDSVTTEQLINTVITDTNAAIYGKQWPLSSYGPFKSRACFPGFTDISPEEVRCQIYEAKNNGTQFQIENTINQYISEAREKLKALAKPNKVITGTIEAIYNNENVKDPFSNFGGFSQNMSLFESANPFNNTPHQISNGFDGANTQSTGSSNFASSLFAEAAKNMFQNPASDTFNTQTGFYQNGIPSAQTESMPNTNIFSSQPFSNQTPNSNFFGNTPIDQDTFITSNNVNGPFGQTNTFFGSSQTPMENVFGQNTDSVFQGSSQNPFSNPSNTFDNPFLINRNPYNQENSIPTEGIYSKLTELTEEELTAFKSDVFEKDQIPENPPPLELCK